MTVLELAETITETNDRTGTDRDNTGNVTSMCSACSSGTGTLQMTVPELAETTPEQATPIPEQ
jgi:hypothetical protein